MRRSASLLQQASRTAEIVRGRDYEHYLCSLFYPSQAARESFLALRAFNVELATVRDVTDDNALTGRLRLQWWRDALDSVYAPSEHAAVQHPVVEELALAVGRHGLRRRWLEHAIDAREANLEQPQPASIADLERYGERTCSSMIYLALQCAQQDQAVQNPTSSDGEDDAALLAATHVGQAMGLVTALRSLPHVLPRGLMPLPVDLMHEADLTVGSMQQAFLVGGGALQQHDEDSPARKQERLAAMVKTVADRASYHLDQAREVPVGNSALPALSSCIIADTFLKRLAGARHDVFSPDLQQSQPLKLQLRLLWFSLTRRW